MNIIKGLPEEVKDGQMVAMDVEVFGQEDGKVHRPTGRFACLSICVDDGSGNVYQIYDEHDVKKVVRLAKKGMWVFHNAVYDLTQLRRWASIEPRFIWDTMLVDRVAHGGLYDTYSLKDLSRRWLDEYMEKEVRDDFSKLEDMSDEMEVYAARDALNTLRIARMQRDALEETQAFGAYKMIDEPAIFPTLDMNPVKVDVEGWTKMAVEFQQKGQEIEDEIGVNVYSPQQVKKALAENGLHVQNTQALTLLEYADIPLVASILDARTYRKAASTYGIKWLEKYVEEDDLVYPSWNITGAETGRRSCSNPNLQNIPARKMPQYREMFISKHYRMIVDDVSAQEPRITAYHSQDEALIAALVAGEDVHQTVADAIGRDRKTGKMINLATSYGMTTQGLAKKLNIPESEAEGLLSAYFMRFRGVFSFISSQRAKAWKTGFVTTVSGRPIYINPYDSQWENNAVNAPIQGGAADFTKMWERLTWEGCKAEGIPYSVWGVVHDELDLDPPKEYYKDTKAVVRDAFHQTAKRLFDGVPFLDDMKTGKTWACKELDDDEYEEDD